MSAGLIGPTIARKLVAMNASITLLFSSVVAVAAIFASFVADANGYWKQMVAAANAMGVVQMVCQRFLDLHPVPPTVAVLGSYIKGLYQGDVPKEVVRLQVLVQERSTWCPLCVRFGWCSFTFALWS